MRVVRDGSLPRDDARGALGRVHAARVGARVLEQLLEKNDKGLAASLGPSRSKAALAVVPAPLPTLAEVCVRCARGEGRGHTSRRVRRAQWS